MGLVKEQHEFLQDVVKLIVFAASKGFIITGGELYRPQDMQELYYYGLNVKGGKLVPGKKRTKTLKSQHPKKLAIDLNFFKDGDYINDNKTAVSELKDVGKYWVSLNPKNRWGGDFNMNEIEDDSFVDAPHFERRS